MLFVTCLGIRLIRWTAADLVGVHCCFEPASGRIITTSQYQTSLHTKNTFLLLGNAVLGHQAQLHISQQLGQPGWQLQRAQLTGPGRRALHHVVISS